MRWASCCRAPVDKVQAVRHYSCLVWWIIRCCRETFIDSYCCYSSMVLLRSAASPRCLTVRRAYGGEHRWQRTAQCLRPPCHSARHRRRRQTWESSQFEQLEELIFLLICPACRWSQFLCRTHTRKHSGVHQTAHRNDDLLQSPILNRAVLGPRGPPTSG